jgi:hypothetical protein
MRGTVVPWQVVKWQAGKETEDLGELGAEVAPEPFRHRTSAQRMRWFRRGYDTGTLEACDTCAASEP